MGDFQIIIIEFLLNVAQNRDGTATAEIIYKKLEKSAVRAEIIDEDCEGRGHQYNTSAAIRRFLKEASVSKSICKSIR